MRSGDYHVRTVHVLDVEPVVSSAGFFEGDVVVLNVVLADIYELVVVFDLKEMRLAFLFLFSILRIPQILFFHLHS